jgi:endoglucanase
VTGRAVLRLPANRRRRLLISLAAPLLLLLLPLLAACDSPSSAAATPQLYVYPGNPLFAASATAKAHGHPTQAAELWAVANTPSGIWAAGQSGEMREVRQVTIAAGQQHEVPVIVAYNLPDRDACGKLSGGTRISDAGYSAWVNQLANAIGSRAAIVIVEPDGLPDIIRHCLSPAAATRRYKLLRYAMRKLSGLPHTQVYLDAGNPGMFANAGSVAGPLRRAGVLSGRGFSANVSNFQWTGLVVSWSQSLERALGHHLEAVIDTSRNGNGPYTGPAMPQWCNPPGRALGQQPKLDPGPAGVAAYLWIKDPGASDGQCNGGPAAGQYWPQYALNLYQARHVASHPSPRLAGSAPGPQ